MLNTLTVGIGAGLASALLFAVVSTGSPLAILLSYLAPLPIFIAAMGWNHRSGLIAALVGIAASMLAFRLSAGLAFGLGLALPAWWLGYLALLGRQSPDGTGEWYPIGRVLLWIACVATCVTLLGAIALGGSYEEFRETMRQTLAAMIKTDGAAQQGLGLPANFNEDAFIATIVAAVPVVTAASFVPMQAFNLWLAGKAVAVSGRMVRPWPDLAETRMPRVALALLAVALVLAFVAQGYVGLTAQALSGALVAAYAMQGLGAIHVLTRGKTSRPLLLAGLYVLLLMFLVWMLPLLALGGVIDALFRQGRSSPPVSPPSNDI